jgi:hypothetical protein
VAVFDDEFQRNFWVIDILLFRDPLDLPFFEEGFKSLNWHIVDCLQLNASVHGEYPINLAIFRNDRRIQVMVRREAGYAINVRGFQFVLSPRFINSVVPLAAFQQLQSRDQRELEIFAAIVLKNVGDAVFGRQLLKQPQVRKNLVEVFLVSMVLKQRDFVSSRWHGIARCQ